MLKEFNLLVSTFRNRENDCISELWYFLRELGDERIEASKVGLPGLIVAKTNLDPHQVVLKLRKMALEKPWDFKYILKIIPIEKVVETSLENIKKIALELAQRIKPNETYKIEANIRLSELSRREIIEAIAPNISRKVNLTKPDKIIRIEVIGEVTGISLITPEEELSIAKIKSKYRAK